MYKGYNLKVVQNKFNQYYSIGQSTNNTIKALVKNGLETYLSPEGILNGSKMESDWFPQLEVDVFLSHAHSNETMAVSFAGWLKSQFGLKTFIDSTVWGYSNELLRKIDEKYCKNASDDNYNYTKRNYSTSHVHMMLSTALNKMMDKCECLIFLNTPEAATLKNTIEQNTKSPWIYSEISTSSVIRRNIPKRMATDRLLSYFQKGGAINMLSEQEQLTVEYLLKTDHLTNIDFTSLVQWQNKCSMITRENEHPLDNLYKLFP